MRITILSRGGDASTRKPTQPSGYLFKEVACDILGELFDTISKHKVVIQFSSLTKILRHHEEHFATISCGWYINSPVENSGGVDQVGVGWDTFRIRLEDHLDFLTQVRVGAVVQG